MGCVTSPRPPTIAASAAICPCAVVGVESGVSARLTEVFVEHAAQTIPAQYSPVSEAAVGSRRRGVRCPRPWWGRASS
jgi:hypothetical protein